MTREEAITELKLFKESVIPWDVPILLAAIDIAVEALQTPPISQRSMYQAGYRQGQKDRPKGKWENDKHDIPRCSECGYMPDYNDFIDDYYYSDFCPNCGSDMRGEDE